MTMSDLWEYGDVEKLRELANPGCDTAAAGEPYPVTVRAAPDRPLHQSIIAAFAKVKAGSGFMETCRRDPHREDWY